MGVFYKRRDYNNLDNRSNENGKSASSNLNIHIQGKLGNTEGYKKKVFDDNYKENMSMKRIPTEPHFYTVNLRYTGVYLFFLLLLQKYRGGSNMYPQSMV